MLCDVILCHAMFDHSQRKLGSNLPSYGLTKFNEGWCVTLHHITVRSVRLYSMKGGVWLYITSQWEVWDYIQWRVVCYFTSHHNEKCETTLNEGWCVTLHHITMRSVRLYITSQWEVWDYIQWRVVCYYTQWRVVCYFPTSHHNEKCETTSCKTHCNGCMDVTWASFWGKAGAGNLVFFRVKWLRPAMKGTSCVRRVRLGSNRARIGSSSVFCNEWLFMCA